MKNRLASRTHFKIKASRWIFFGVLTLFFAFAQPPRADAENATANSALKTPFMYLPTGPLALYLEESPGDPTRRLNVQNFAKGNTYPVLEARQSDSGEIYKIRLFGSNYWINPKDATSPNTTPKPCATVSCSDLVASSLQSLNRASTSGRRTNDPNLRPSSNLEADFSPLLSPGRVASPATSRSTSVSRVLLPEPKVVTANAQVSPTGLIQNGERSQAARTAYAAPSSSASQSFGVTCLVKPTSEKPPNFDILSIPARKKAFVRFFGPLAVEAQAATGYPASIAMAQFIEESGWGTSDLAELNFNYAGITCSTGPEIPHYLKDPNGITTASTFAKCRQGFQRFQSPREGVIGFFSNLLYKKLTAGSYANIRKLASDALKKGRVANPAQIAASLESYSTTEGYGDKILQIARTQELAKLDQMKICQ